MSFIAFILIVIAVAFLIRKSSRTGFFFFRSPRVKGKIGEFNVYSRLNFLNQAEYKILNNVLIYTKDGRSVQIDHIIVSVYGIFVIETKNYKGWIFGNENSENWMQAIYKEKNQFRNPVKQNFSHIYALKEILADYQNIKYIPIVVFSGNAVLKEIDSKTYVIYDSELLKVIKSESLEQIISQDEIQKITNIIIGKNIQNREAEDNHILNIQRTVLERQMKKENLICPKCGKELKLRNGKYGKFYGCSNYPYCKFTMKY